MRKAQLKNTIRQILLPQYYWYQRYRAKRRAKIVSDEEYVLMKYNSIFGVLPDLNNPQKYTEYVTKILLTPPSDLAVMCVDKYEVRSYVEKKDGSEILNDLIGVYDTYNDLKQDFANFPNRFVLKATHGCGWNYICKDKNTVNHRKLRMLIKHWLKSNFYYAQRELVYKNLKPRIICEKYLEDESGALIDYKVHCFNGEPKFINVVHGRYSDVKYNTYDTDWKYLNVYHSDNLPSDKNWIIDKPSVLDELLQYSRALAENFQYVRVDLYIVNNRIYFGELTFTPGNGSFTFSDRDNHLLGSFFKEVEI